MQKPDLTLAICTHDNAPMLERVLRQLAHQRVRRGTTWELVVVDNRSGDRTPEVLGEWSASGRFPSMRSVREERLGLAIARRTAIAAARSDLIAFIDDDCLPSTGWIEAAVEFARRRPRAGAFGGRVRIEWESPPTALGKACEWALARQDRGDRSVQLAGRGGVPLVGAGIVVRRRALQDSGWVERANLMGRKGKALSSGDDAEISFRIRSAGWELWYTPTMRLRHVLPAWRSEYAYLARLHRAIGKTLPYIWTIGGVYRRTPLSGPFFVGYGLTVAARKALSSLNYRLRGRTLQAQRRWMEAHYAYGCFLGAFDLPSEAGLALPRPRDRARRLVATREVA